MKRELKNLKKGTSEPLPLPKYISRVRTIWNDLKASGHDIEESEVVLNVLAGLPKEYETTVAIIEAAEKEVGLDEILSRLLNVEQRVTSQEEQETVYVAQGFRKDYKKGPMPPYKLHDNKHRPAGKHADKECFYCHKKGHIKAECRKRIADEKTGGSGHDKGMALMTFKYEEEDNMHLWALDSGATKHLSPYKELFKNLRGLEEETYITSGNKTKEMFHGIGDICMMTRL